MSPIIEKSETDLVLQMQPVICEIKPCRHSHMSCIPTSASLSLRRDSGCFVGETGRQRKEISNVHCRDKRKELSMQGRF